jgi:hypothetical protein
MHVIYSTRRLPPELVDGAEVRDPRFFQSPVGKPSRVTIYGRYPHIGMIYRGRGAVVIEVGAGNTPLPPADIPGRSVLPEVDAAQIPGPVPVALPATLPAAVLPEVDAAQVLEPVPVAAPADIPGRSVLPEVDAAQVLEPVPVAAPATLPSTMLPRTRAEGIRWLAERGITGMHRATAAEVAARVREVAG